MGRGARTKKVVAHDCRAASEGLSLGLGRLWTSKPRRSNRGALGPSSVLPTSEREFTQGFPLPRLETGRAFR